VVKAKKMTRAEELTHNIKDVVDVLNVWLVEANKENLAVSFNLIGKDGELEGTLQFLETVQIQATIVKGETLQ
jgi:hypothetical protein